MDVNIRCSSVAYCQAAAGSVFSVVICVTLLRTDAGAGPGDRVGLYAAHNLCLRVTVATAPSHTNHGKPQTHGIQLNVFLKLLPEIHLTVRLSFTKAPNHDPMSLVTLSLVPVDLCDIHVEFVDQISTESTSSFQSLQDQMLGNLPVSAPL